jgi:bile acid-coenzyme A ligase
MAGAAPFGAVISALAREDPEASAVTCGDITLTRRHLDLRSNRRAHRYAAAGVTDNSLVVLQLPNSVELLECAVAVWKLGATPLVLSASMPAAERAPVLELANPALVVDTPLADPDVDAALADYSDEPPPARAARCWRASTSGGSTGRPKVIYTNIPAVTDPDQRTLHLRRGGCVVDPGPMYHGAPFLFATFGLLRGKHVVLLPRFDPGETLAAVERHRADYLLLVPTMMNRIWKLGDEVRLSTNLTSLEVMLHLGATCPAPLKRDWIAWLGADRVHELYAGTEGLAMTWIRGDEWLAHPGSVGRPVGGAQMQALDADLRPLPAGEVGEIFMRAEDGVAPTYTYAGATARRQGKWESLGDMGWVDTDGYVYIVDRRTDMVVSGGSNVYPAEVEAAIESHPQVHAAVVFGLPDPDLGQRLHAVVEPVPGAALSEAEIRAHLATRILRYKTPRSFEFTMQSLRDDSGKTRRSALAAARMDHTVDARHADEATCS